MRSLSLLACLLIVTLFTIASDAQKDFNLKPFKIDLTGEIPRMRSLVNNTRLPNKALDPEAGQEKGIELDFLRELQSDWSTNFDWKVQQAELNK
jgi:hypothetical protein